MATTSGQIDTAVLDAKLTALDAKLTALDAKLREANGTLKDLRAERRAGEELLARKIPGEVAARLEKELAAGLKEFGDALEKAIGLATEAVYNRFDLICAICLGEDATSREGKPPLDELIRRYIAQNGPMT